MKDKNNNGLKFREDSDYSNGYAVIGIGLKMPQAEDAEEFWNMLCRGTDCVGELSENRKKDAEEYRKFRNIPKEKMQYIHLAYLQDVSRFDYPFFGMSFNEARLMDPNQRIFLQMAWQAIADAGYEGDRIRGSKTGVFIGYSNDPVYKTMVTETEQELYSLAQLGNSPPIMGGRFSYLLDLKGPNLLIDTTCSSTLVAVHTACRSIRDGECDMALVGGVKTYPLPIRFDYQTNIGIESPDGVSRSFDDRANGAGGGEGAAAILIKPVAQAIADSDRIYAVIMGSAVNHDGSASSISAPDAKAQADVICQAWENARIHPRTVSYVEAHGTGTKLGDPVEVAGLQAAFESWTDDRNFCAIGSVKSNIGHLDSMAGLAGFVKACLCLQHGELVPTIHFQRPNRFIHFMDTALYVNDSVRPWKPDGGVKRCGVSSFGISGTNCHAVLQEAPQVDIRSGYKEAAVFVLSAKDKDAIVRYLDRYTGFLSTSSSDFQDICYTAATGRQHFNYRIAVIAHDTVELKEKLSQCQRFFLSGQQQWEEGIYINPLMQTASDTPIKRGGDAADTIEPLCRSYVQGEKVDWAAFWKGKNVRKVKLPAYPFENLRCWINIPEERRGQSEYAEQNVSLTGREDQNYTEFERAVGEQYAKVLGLQRLDINSRLYELGGDSIIAIQIGNAICKNTPYTVTVVDIMTHSIQEMQPGKINELPVSASDKTYEAIPEAAYQPYYRVSFSQQRQYLMDKTGHFGLSYNMPAVFEIEGEVDEARLAGAVKDLIERYEILRTSYEERDGRIVQVIHEQLDTPFLYASKGFDTIEQEMAEFMEEFDLAKAPLFKVKLVSKGQRLYRMLFDMHHIVADGMSVNLLFWNLIKLYQGKQLPDVLQYKDYAEWQFNRWASGAMQEHEKFWLLRYASWNPNAGKVTAVESEQELFHRGNDFYHHFDRELTEAVQQFADEQGMSLFMVLIAALAILIFRYENCKDLVIGTPISGRNHPDLNDVIGMLINTLPLRFCTLMHETAGNFLQSVRDQILEAYKYQDYPFDLLVQKLREQKGNDWTSMFNIMFTFQNMDTINNEKVEGLTFQLMEYKNGTSKFDIELEAITKNDELHFVWEFNSTLYDDEIIKCMAYDYQGIIETIMNHMDISIKDVMIQSASEFLAALESEVAIADVEFQFE